MNELKTILNNDRCKWQNCRPIPKKSNISFPCDCHYIACSSSASHSECKCTVLLGRRRNSSALVDMREEHWRGGRRRMRPARSTCLDRLFDRYFCRDEEPCSQAMNNILNAKYSILLLKTLHTISQSSFLLFL